MFHDFVYQWTAQEVCLCKEFSRHLPSRLVYKRWTFLFNSSIFLFVFVGRLFCDTPNKASHRNHGICIRSYVYHWTDNSSEQTAWDSHRRVAPCMCFVFLEMDLKIKKILNFPIKIPALRLHLLENNRPPNQVYVSTGNRTVVISGNEMMNCSRVRQLYKPRGADLPPLLMYNYCTTVKSKAVTNQ